MHFVPVDHDENNEEDQKRGKAMPIPASADWAMASKKQRRAQEEGVGHEAQNHDDAVIQRHMQEHARNGKLDFKERLQGRPMAAVDGQTALHKAAGLGQLEIVEKLLSQSQAMLHSRDANDWQPVHEAARGGHLDTLKYLVDMGADIGARTSNGGTPLFWANARLPKGHPAIAYLVGIGAPDSEDVKG